MRIKEISAFDTLGLVKKNQIFEDIQIHIDIPFLLLFLKKKTVFLEFVVFY